MSASKTFENLDPAKQEAVLDQAMDEFAEHGFAGASMNRLVKRLGIAKGSIFKYFGTKEGLFKAVFNRSVELFSGPLRRARDASADKPAFERLEQSLLAGLEFIRKHPNIHRIYLKMLFQEKFPLRERFLTEVRLYSAKFLKPIVEQGVARGEFRADLDIDMAVFLLDAVMDRFLTAHSVEFMDSGLGIHRAGPEYATRRIAQLMELLRSGLGAHVEKQPVEKS